MKRELVESGTRIPSCCPQNRELSLSSGTERDASYVAAAQGPCCKPSLRETAALQTLGVMLKVTGM